MITMTTNSPEAGSYFGYAAPQRDLEKALKWTYGDRYYLQATQREFQDMFEEKFNERKGPTVELSCNNLIEIGKRALKNSEIAIAEKSFGNAIRKEKLENATTRRNPEPYYYLAEALEKKASKADMKLLQKQKLLLQSTALYNFVQNLSLKGNAECEIFKKMSTAISRKISDIQESLILSAGGNLLHCRFAFKNKKKVLEQIRRQAKSSLESIEKKYKVQTSDEEDLRIIFVSQAMEIRNVFKTIALGVRQLLVDIINECLEVLGKPPCNHEVIVLGSLAREEMTPYSDVEWAILTSSEEEDCKDFFRNLTNLVHFQIINLGETILPCMDIKALNNEWFYDDVTPRGVSFDAILPQASKTPLGNMQDFELIHTPANMAEFQSNYWYKKNSGLGEILLTVAPLEDDKHILTDEYKNIVKKILDGACDSEDCAHDALGSPTRATCRGFDTLRKDNSRYGETIPGALVDQLNDGKLYDVKKEIYRLTDRVVAGLSKLFHIGKNGAFEILEELCKTEVLEPSGKDNLASAVAISLKLRLSTYLKAGKQEEEIKTSHETTSFDGAVYTCHMPREQELFHFFYVAIPLHEELHHFCATGKSASKDFLRRAFFDYSDAIKGHIYCRVVNYDKALIYYDRALKADPGNIDLQLRRVRVEFIAQDNDNAFGSLREKLCVLIQVIHDKYNPQQTSVFADLQETGEAMDLPHSGKESTCDQSLAIAYRDQLFQALIFSSSISTLQGDFTTSQSMLEDCLRLNNVCEFNDWQKMIIKLDLLRIALTSGGQVTQEDCDKVISQLNEVIENEGVSTRSFVWLNQLAQFLVHQGRTDEAYRCLQRALTMGRILYGSNFNLNLVATLIMIGMVSWWLLMYEEAKFYLEQSLKMLPSEYSLTITMFMKVVHLMLASICVSTGARKEAALYLQKGLSMTGSETSTDFMVRCIMHGMMATSWKHLGELEKAWQSATDAKDCLRGITDGQERVAMFCAVSETYLTFGKEEEAILLLNQGLQELDRMSEGKHKVKYLNCLGNVLARQGLTEEAESYYKNALAILKIENKDTHGVIRNLLDVSNMLLARGKSSEAAEYVNEASKCASTLVNGDQKRTYLGEIAKYWKKLGKVHKARKCLEEALEVCSEAVVCSKIPIVEFHLHVALGDLLNDSENSMSGDGRMPTDQLNKAKGTHYDRAAEVLRRHSASGNFNSTTVLLFTLLATKYRSVDITEEENLLLEALEMCETTYGLNNVNEQVASVLFELSDVYQTKSDYARAINCLDRSLRIEMEMHCADPYHPHIAHLISLVNDLCLECPGNKQLEDAVHRIIEFTELDHLAQETGNRAAKANCLVSLALLFLIQGQFNKAETLNHMASDIFASIQKNDVPSDSTLNTNFCELIKLITEKLSATPELMPLLKKAISCGLMNQLFQGVARESLAVNIATIFRSMSTSTVSESSKSSVNKVLKSSQEILEKSVALSSTKTSKILLDVGLETMENVSCPPARSEETSKGSEESYLRNSFLDDVSDSGISLQKSVSGGKGSTNSGKGTEDGIRYLARKALDLELVCESIQYDIKREKLEQARNSIEDKFSPLVKSIFDNCMADPFQYIMTEILKARKENNFGRMPMFIKIAAKYPCDLRTKAKIIRLSGECHLYYQDYRMAETNFMEAVAFHRSSKTASRGDDLEEYGDILIGLTKSRMFCTKVEGAWCACSEGITLLLGREPEYQKSRLLAELFYLAAKCKFYLSKSSRNRYNCLREAISFCQEATAASVVVDKHVGSSDFLEEFCGHEKQEFFAMKCEINLLHATILSLLGYVEKAKCIAKEMSAFLESLAVVLEEFSGNAWPGGEKDFLKIRRRFCSWIGRALVIAGETGAAICPLTKSLASFVILPPPGELLPQEELLSLLDAINATNASIYPEGSSAFEETIELCKKQFVEQSEDVKALQEFFGILGNLYVDCGRIEEAIVAYKAGLVVADCMEESDGRNSRDQMVLYLANAHRLQAIRNMGKDAQEERKLAESYYTKTNIRNEDGSIFKGILYGSFLCEEDRFEEAVAVLKRVTETGDTLWNINTNTSYSKRFIHDQAIQEYMESHGDLVTVMGNIAYNTLVRAYVGVGKRKEAVRAYEKLSSSGKEVRPPFSINKTPCLPYLLTSCQKMLLSLCKEQSDLAFADFDFPLSRVNVARVYYALSEYELTLESCKRVNRLNETTQGEMDRAPESLQRDLLSLRLAGNALVMLERGNESYSYFIPFLKLLQRQYDILSKPFEKQQIVLSQYSFAQPFYVYRSLGMLLTENGKTDIVLECYQYCLSLDPDYNCDQNLAATVAELYETKALMEGKDDKGIYQKWMDEAEECFQKLLHKTTRLTPFVEGTYAALLSRTQRYDEAISHFEQAVKGIDTGISFSQVDIPLVGVHLAREIQTRGEIRLPLKLFIYNQMALTYFKMGEFDKAQESAHRMEEYASHGDLSQPLFALIRSFLGYTYMEIGNEDKAVEIFVEVLEVTPDNVPVNHALQSCRIFRDE